MKSKDFILVFNFFNMSVGAFIGVVLQYIVLGGIAIAVVVFLIGVVKAFVFTSRESNEAGMKWMKNSGIALLILTFSYSIILFTFSQTNIFQRNQSGAQKIGNIIDTQFNSIGKSTNTQKDMFGN